MKLRLECVFPVPEMANKILQFYDGPDSSINFTLVCHVSAWTWVSVALSTAFKRKLLYVMISNVCGMYMRTISQIYQIMGSLCLKLAEQVKFRVTLYIFQPADQSNTSGKLS